MLHPADIAELYENLSVEEATYLYLLLDPEKAADVLVGRANAEAQRDVFDEDHRRRERCESRHQ